MKITILANESRKRKDKPIIDEAEQVFDKVIYAPIKKTRFDIATKKHFGRYSNGITLEKNGDNLSDSDCILPIPVNIQKELFFTALTSLNGSVMPFDAKTYMLTINKGLLSNVLGSKGIPIRNIVIVASNISMDKINERIKYPVIVRPPNKHVMVTNKQTLKDVLSLYKYGTPILIETPIKSEKSVWVFVSGDEVIAGYEKTKNASKAAAVDDDLKKLAINARRIIGCDYCAIRFLKSKNSWIFDQLTFSPDFSKFQKITGVNIGRHIVASLRNKASKPESSGWQKKIEEMVRMVR